MVLRLTPYFGLVPNLRAYPRGLQEGFVLQKSKCRSWEPIWFKVTLLSHYSSRQILDSGTSTMTALSGVSSSRNRPQKILQLILNLKAQARAKSLGRAWPSSTVHSFQSRQGPAAGFSPSCSDMPWYTPLSIHWLREEHLVTTSTQGPPTQMPTRARKL